MKEKYKHFIPIQASKPKPSIKQILENQNIMQYIQHENCVDIIIPHANEM